MNSQEEEYYEIHVVKEFLENPKILVKILLDPVCKDLKKINRSISMLSDSELDKLIEETSLSKLFAKHRRLLASSQFNFNSLANDLDKLQSILDLTPDCTQGSSIDYLFPEVVPELSHYKVNNRAINRLVPIEVIKMYMKKQSKDYNLVIYENYLRFQSTLNIIFFLFYLKPDFKLLRTIDASKIRSIDPLTRIAIRKEVMEDSSVMGRYFNEAFNLKEYVFNLFANFFPNTSSIFLRRGGYISLSTLQITRVMFEVGLWNNLDTFKLARILLEKSTQMSGMEEECEQDNTIEDDQLNSLKTFFKEARKNIAQILIHIIVLINDHCLIDGLSWPACKTKADGWNNVFFKNSEMFITCANILYNYLMRKSSLMEFLEDNEQLNFSEDYDKKPLAFYTNILLFIFVDKKSDIFVESNRLIDKELFTYYVSKTVNKIVQEQAKSIRDDIENLNSNIRDLQFNNLTEEVSINKELENEVNQICTNLFDLLGDKKSFSRLMVASRYNLVPIFLSLFSFCDKWIGDKCKMRIADCLIEMCKLSKVNQAQLFLGEGSIFFRIFSTRNPLLGSEVSKNIFSQDILIFDINLDIFMFTLGIYEQNMDKIISSSLLEKDEWVSCELNPVEVEKNPSIHLPYLVSAFSYNIYLAQMIKGEIGRPYDLIIQERVQKYITPVFKKIMSPSADSSEDQAERIDWVSIKEQILIGKNMGELYDISVLTTIDRSKVDRILVDVAYSFLVLLNSMSERYYYGSTFAVISELLQNIEEFDYLFGSKDKMIFQIELTKLYEKYKVCISNNLLTQRASFLSGNYKQVCSEYLFDRMNYDYSIKLFLIYEIESIRTVADYMETNPDEGLTDLSRDYIFEGVFPLLYKWFQSLRLTFFYENVHSERSDLEEIKSMLFELTDLLLEVKPRIEAIIGESFNIDPEFLKIHREICLENMFSFEYSIEEDEIKDYDLLIVRRICKHLCEAIKNSYSEKLVGILSKFSRPTALLSEFSQTPVNPAFPKSNKDSLKSLYKTFIKFQSIYSLEKAFCLTSDDNQVNLMRRYFTKDNVSLINTLIVMLERIYEPEQRLETFKNEAYNNIATLEKRGHKMDDERAELFQKQAQVRNDLSMDQQEIDRIIQAYEVNIQALNKKIQENSELRMRIDENPWIKDLGNFFFFRNESLSGYLELFNQLMQYNIPGLKHILYFLMTEQEDSFYPKIWQEGAKLSPPQIFKMIENDKKMLNKYEEINNERRRVYNQQMKIFEEKKTAYYKKYDEWVENGYVGNQPTYNIQEPGEFKPYLYTFIRERNKKFIDITAKYLMEFFIYSKYKTFYDKQRDNIWQQFIKMTDVFKNLCENGATFFKRFLSSVELLDCPTSYKDFLFNYYLHVETLFTMSNLWKNEYPRITNSDAPELFDIMDRAIHVLTEFVNGPCPFNQRYIHQYRPDIFCGIILRVVDDVSPNSKFYNLKLRVLEYYYALMEEEGFVGLDEDTSAISDDPYFVTKFIGNNLTISSALRNMTEMLKRLYISRMIKSSKSYKKKILAKSQMLIDIRLNEIKKEGGEEAERKKTRFEMITNREINFFETDPDCIINEFICAAAPSFTVYQVFNLYKTDEDFSNHLIVRFATKFFEMIEHIAPHIPFFSLHLDTKRSYILKYFSEFIDRDDLVTEDQSIETRNNNFVDEELIFLMFIMKITKKIEVVVQNSWTLKPFNKFVHFPILPKCLFLDQESKKFFLRNMDFENKRSYLKKYFRKFDILMEQNYRSNQRAPLTLISTDNESTNLQRKVVYFFGILINIICLLSFKLDKAQGQDNRSLISGDYHLIILISSLIFAIYTALYTLAWLLFQLKPEYIIQREQFKLDNPFDDPDTLMNRISILIWYSILKEKGALNFLFHTVFSILGIVLNPVFHTLHLLLIVNISPTAKYVLRASVAHLDQLLSTFLLAIFVIYSYSMINANYYSDKFDATDVGDIDVCKTLFSCFMYVLNLGLRNGGGVSDSQELYAISNSKFAGKMIFDITFFVFVNVISLNIIFGIIIDTFGEMRSEADELSNFLI